LRCPYIDELVVVELKGKDKGIKGALDLGRVLRKKNFDLVIDLQNNRKSHLLSFLSACVNRYGYDNKKYGFFLNHRIKDDSLPIDPLTHQFRILNMLGIELKNNHLELWPAEEDRKYIDELLGGEWLSANQKLVGINISASSRWETKAWPPEHIVKLCELLKHRDIRVVVTGTEKDLPQVNRLMKMLKDIKPINACGKTTVNQLACLIKKCVVYISADSSPLHIAAAMNTPIVALFGPTDYRRHLPAVKNCVVLKKDLPCSPCYKSKCKTKKCMQGISPEEVLGAVEKLLK
jgi:lipopolysaccharide heptosyltransferase II